MTLRTKSRSWQWLTWAAGALAGVVAYVVLARAANVTAGFDLFEPSVQRILLPVLAVFGVFAWETRWDGSERKGRSGRGERRRACDETPPPRNEAVTENVVVDVPRRETRPSLPKAGPAPGETLYAQARAMSHQAIPDLEKDGEYLRMLVESAVQGYPRALAKLGDYAMRRCAWVEAYYWMWLAQRNGMRNLAPVLLGIRHNWVMDGHSDQRSNVNEVFTEERGDVGRALLRIATGRDAAAAREYLRANFPEYLK